MPYSIESLSSCVCKCGFLGFFFQVMHIKFRMLKCCVVYVMYHAGHWTEPAMLCKTYSVNTQPQTEKCDHIEFLFILFFFVIVFSGFLISCVCMCLFMSRFFRLEFNVRKRIPIFWSKRLFSSTQ